MRMLLALMSRAGMGRLSSEGIEVLRIEERCETDED